MQAGEIVVGQEMSVLVHGSSAGFNLPRWIDGPTSPSQVAKDLLRSRREDVILVLYMDDRHRFVGHAVTGAAGSS